MGSASLGFILQNVQLRHIERGDCQGEQGSHF